ncbi:Hsp70 family protein [Candidatus Poribacteria bacterium]|nr:Hsp70 family protein [Candidatus Poribacteria bacterium]MYA55212.1 Hsp70 family protein [Candidatus Poribacteria bacterium]
MKPNIKPTDRRNYYIGIDLGTTNSVMAWGSLNPQTNQLETKIVEVRMMIERGGTGKKELLPSCVYFKEGGSPIVGEYAKTMIGRTNRVVKSIKSEMGTQTAFDFDGSTYNPAVISSQILTHLAASAESLFGFVPDDVVITVPASFDSDMREATIEAARLAGFRTQEDDGSPRDILLDEPRAALYDFVNRQNKGEIPETRISFHEPQTVLVFDLGGGTLDVSLHNVSYQQEQHTLNIEDLAISRYTQIGGDDFDQKLADHFWEVYADRLPNDFDDSQMNMLKSEFREYAEQAKVDLSSEIENGALMGYLDPKSFDPEFVETEIIKTPFENQVFQYDLTLSEYEDIVEPLLAPSLTLDAVNQLDTLSDSDNIIYPILDVLRKSEQKIGSVPNVDAVLLNGGMTKFHTIQKRLETLFGLPPITAGDPDKAVARGAVVYHYDLHRGIKPSRIVNDTINIEIDGDKVKPLVEAGTILPLPQPKPIDNLHVSENSRSLRLPFYLGSGKDTQPPNRPILERTVRFQRQLLKGEPVFMQVQVDERGIMSVEGWPKADPDQKFTVSIDPNQPAVADETSNGLTRNPGEFDRTDNTREEGQSIPGAKQPFVPSGSQAAAESQGSILEVHPELMVMKKNISQYIKTSEFNRKRIIDEQITRQHVRIIEASNAEDFISPLLDNINYVNNYGRGKTIMLLGDLANLCSDIDLLYDIYDAAAALSHPEKIKSMHPIVIENVVTNAIKTIGKTGLSSAESHLINLITPEIPTTVRPIAVYSIGKCCYSVNALEHLKRLMKYGEDTDRVAINWAFGKMGSREHETPLSIQELESVISILIDQLQTELDNDVKQNGIYALGEICDRRDCAKDIIKSEKSKDVIRFIAPFLNASTDGSLADLANMQRIHAIKKIADISINMIRGIQLSKEQAESLLAIRAEN